MRKTSKMLAAAALAAAMTVTMAAGAWADGAELNITYQYGLAYTPAVIAMDQGLIEAAYKEATGEDLTVNWTQMNNGADINTAFAAGEIDAGFLALGPIVSGISKGIGYRIFSNSSGQPHKLMTNDPEVKELKDLIGTDKQIALVTIGSLHHVLLAMALDEAGEDPHALDANLIGMKHPDGMAALENGQVCAHLTSSPYIQMEEKNEDLHEVGDMSAVWSAENSYIVGVASEELHDENPEIYQALCDGIKAAMDYINENPEETAAFTAELDGNSVEDELEYLNDGNYAPEVKGIGRFAKFMEEAQFLDGEAPAYEDMVFDNVVGD